MSEDTHTGPIQSAPVDEDIPPDEGDLDTEDAKVLGGEGNE